MDPFGITERAVQFSIDRVSGFLKPSKAERDAAFELLVELSTRTTVAPLAVDEGSLREAMSSVYIVFDETRTLLRKHGPSVAKDRGDGNVSFAVLAVRVLNDVLRPTLSRWHPSLEDHEARRPKTMGKSEWERRWCDYAHCRSELDVLREHVRAYIDTLGRIAGTPGLAEAALPLPASKPLGQKVVKVPEISDDDKPRKRMVHWFELRQLWELLWAYRRKPAPSQAVAGDAIDLAARSGTGDFWFDYVADLGDAFDPTIAVAWQIGRENIVLPPAAAGDLPVPPDCLPRGKLLVFGGDTVYPFASRSYYRQQLVLPYRLAWEPSPATEAAEFPTVVAIPGNHDWIGGIDHFEDLFLKGEPFANHWRTEQKNRWFAVKLPQGWWLWGIDTGLHDELPREERAYFESIKLQREERVILCTPVPLWQLRQKRQKKYFELRSFFDDLVEKAGATMPLFLSGDSHLFARYGRSNGIAEEHHITAGGGGAFLHPTHNLAESIPYERGQPEFTLTRRWPSAADSVALAPRWHGVATPQFLSLIPVVAVLHLLFDFLVRSGFRDLGPPTPGPALNDLAWRVVSAWPGWFALILALVIPLFVTRPNSDESLLARGAKVWGLLHGGAQVIVLVAAATLGRWLVPDRTWRYYVALGFLGSLASLAVFLVMTTLINRKIKANDNTAFSSAHSRRFKHFLRMRIDSDGQLTIFAVGLDPVGEKWFRALREKPALVPPSDTAGGPHIHYLWGAHIGDPPKKEKTVMKRAAHPADPPRRAPSGVATGGARPLTVYVAWHPADEEGQTMSQRILTTLQGDPEWPAGERIGIPVRFRTSIAAGPRTAGPPPPLALDNSSPAVVAIVAGPHLLADASWRAWARRTHSQVEPLGAGRSSTHRLVVLATSREALGASDLFGTTSVLRLVDLEAGAQARTAMISVLAAAADLLVSDRQRLNVFISHAKVDGATLAGALDQRIAEAKLGAFLDSHAIVEGLSFEELIDAATADPTGAAVAIVTDAYAGREWCRIEALRVKQFGVPLVALDAVKSGQERTLPYLGNVPLVRLGEDLATTLDEVLIALLREVVRSRWFPGHVARLGGDPSGLIVMSRPPELLTVLHALGQATDAVSSIIYPDPPLASNELAVLEQAVKHLKARRSASGHFVAGPRFVTPTTVGARSVRG